MIPMPDDLYGDPEMAKLFRRVCETLNGNEWIRPTAANLDVSYTTVRRWADARIPIPAGVWPHIIKLIEQRKDVGFDAIRQIRSAILART